MLILTFILIISVINIISAVIFASGERKIERNEQNKFHALTFHCFFNLLTGDLICVCVKTTCLQWEVLSLECHVIISDFKIRRGKKKIL